MSLDLRKNQVPKIRKDEIDPAIKDEAWQKFRRSLKGLSTLEKTERLEQWLKNHPGRKGIVQVVNYWNALRRGGQVKKD